jgi:cytochrome c-type biogenesis protein CcmF
MGVVGNAALLLSLVVIISSIALMIYGHRRDSRPSIDLSVNSFYGVSILVSLAAFSLWWSLVTSDFHLTYVAEHTDLSLPWYYRISAFWSGQEGSFLLWTWMLAVCSAFAIWQKRRLHPELFPYVVIVLGAVNTLFLVLSGVMNNAFDQLAWIPGDGQGLNPILQNPVMAIHPPVIFIGFACLAIPFAFAMSALLSGRLGDEWIKASHKWALVAWLFLTIGILLGAQWAYTELGWGGYWAWDPIENAALLPWLTATALLHSMNVQRRLGQFRIWTFGLTIITFGLPIFGTFLVRSGLVASVHSYAPSSAGLIFLMLLGILIGPPTIALIRRLPDLRADTQKSRVRFSDGVYLLTNVALCVLAALIFVATVFPSFAERLFGWQITLGPAFFNQIAGPGFLAVFILMALCPLARYRGDATQGLANRYRRYSYLLLATAIVAVALFIAGIREQWALLAFSVCVFILAATVADWVRVIGGRRSPRETWTRTLGPSIWQQRSRFGASIVHIGVVLIGLGVIGSSFYHTQTDTVLLRGQAVSVRGYVIRYDGMAQSAIKNKASAVAQFSVYQNGRQIGSLSSRADFYANANEPKIEPGIRSTLLEDLYLVLAGWENSGEKAVVRILVNPLVLWLWIGSALIVLGGILAFWPAPQANPVGEIPRRRRVAKT